ncbi:MAG: DinB family protein [Phototrophicales bacterium]|nr:MAG: DinB family protein [Phototrophicales bacterium]
MKLDFSPVRNGELKLSEFAQNLTVADLRDMTNASIDTILTIIADLDDADVTFDPTDPLADDPYAKEGEEKIGWSIAHLVVHVTASSEEWATYGSILARGIPYPREPRIRYETDWKSVTTKAQCLQRLEESRRMRLGYLDAFPDHPSLDTYRDMSENFVNKYGQCNAIVAVLLGLMHEEGHFAQFRDVHDQAIAAKVGSRI